MPKKSRADSEMLAFLQSKTVDHISDYSQRGRMYQTLSDEDLLQSWKLIWEGLEADPLSEKKRDAQADISAEFSLRHIEPPWAAVTKQVDSFLAASDRAHRKWEKENPEAAAKQNVDIRAELQKFLGARKKSN